MELKISGGITASCKLILTPWSSWSSCSKTCGNGQRKRTRNFHPKAIPTFDLKHCSEKLLETSECFEGVCAGDFC